MCEMQDTFLQVKLQFTEHTHNRSSLLTNSMFVEFIYLLKFTCNFKISTYQVLMVICGHVQCSKTSQLPDMSVLSQLWLKKVMLCFLVLFSSYPGNKYRFRGLVSSMVFFILVVILGGFCCLNLSPSIMLKFCLVYVSAESLCYAFLRQKYMCSISKFHLDMSYSAIGYEFSVNESAIYIK